MRIVGIAAVVLLAASCGNSGADADGDGQISMEEATAEAQSSAIRPEPGQYRAVVELISVDIPGAPPQVVDMMKQSMAQQTTEYCLTPEEAERGFEEMARQSNEGNCTFDRFDVDGGSIDAAMTCNQDGQNMSMTMQGTGTSTSSDMTMTMNGDIPGMGSMAMTMNVEHERIGDCAG